MWVAGVDGCRAGWFVVLRDHNIGSLSHYTVSQLAEVLNLPERPEVIGVDMPIGLLDCAEEGGRECDVTARQLLRWPRRNSVFSPPVRAALHSPSYAEACTANAASSPKGLRISRQCFGLFPKLLEVDQFMNAERQKVVLEVHPELSFYEMNSAKPMLFAKKTSTGAKDRLELLERAGFLLSEIVRTARMGRVGLDDILDACAACWTTERIACGMAIRVPAEPKCDSMGLRMEIWR